MFEVVVKIMVIISTVLNTPKNLFKDLANATSTEIFRVKFQIWTTHRQARSKHCFNILQMKSKNSFNNPTKLLLGHMVSVGWLPLLSWCDQFYQDGRGYN